MSYALRSIILGKVGEHIKNACMNTVKIFIKIPNKRFKRVPKTSRKYSVINSKDIHKGELKNVIGLLRRAEKEQNYIKFCSKFVLKAKNNA